MGVSRVLGRLESDTQKPVLYPFATQLRLSKNEGEYHIAKS